jgi:hypothetical protein
MPSVKPKKRITSKQLSNHLGNKLWWRVPFRPLFKKTTQFREGGLARSKMQGDRIFKVVEYCESPFRLIVVPYGLVNYGQFLPSTAPKGRYVDVCVFQDDLKFEPVKVSSLKVQRVITRARVELAGLNYGCIKLITEYAPLPLGHSIGEDIREAAI